MDKFTDKNCKDNNICNCGHSSYKYFDSYEELEVYACNQCGEMYLKVESKK